MVLYQTYSLMKKNKSELPYIVPMINACSIQLENIIAISTTPESTPSSEVVEDYTDGGGEWSSDISF